MNTTEQLSGIDDIPIYREGDSDQASFGIFLTDPIAFHLRAFRRHGPIYRTWFRSALWIIMGGTEANEFIWRNNDLWSYSKTNVPFTEERGPDHVTALDGDSHRHKRAVLKPAFDQAPALRYLADFNDMLHADLVRAGASGPVDLSRFWAFEITKIASRTAAVCDVPDPVLARMAQWEFESLQGLFLEEGRAEYVGRPSYRALHDEVFEWLGRIVDERLAAPVKPNDNFESVIKARMASETGPLVRDSLIDDLYLTLISGSHNTANLINWAILFTFRTPGWLQEVRAEVDGWDGKDVMALAKLPKVKATIAESLRLRPGVVFTAKDAVEPFAFGGYQIPSGTRVLHSIVLAQFLEELYPDPFEFKPQRFVENSRFAPKSLGAFGGGAHICLGRNHSLLQGPVAFAQVVKYFDLEFTDSLGAGRAVGFGGLRPYMENWAKLIPRHT
jgi:cytochrome P450